MWAYADGISKKAWQERGRSRQEKLRCKRLGRCVDPSRQRGKRLQVQMLGAPEQARGRAPGAGGGPGLDPGKHRRGRRGASDQGSLAPHPCPSLNLPSHGCL